MAGDAESVRRIAMDIAGYKNHTTELLLKAYKECGDSRSEGMRLQKVALLYPLKSLSLQFVRELGFDVGRDLWDTVQSHNPWLFGESYKSASQSGRKKVPDSADMAGAWLSVSHDTSSLDKKLFYGTRAQAALQVQKVMGSKATIRTIMNHRPKCILFTSKPTDLCPICVQLKRLQRSLVTPLGTKAVKKKDKKSIQEKINVLKHHKDYVGKVRSEYFDSFKGPKKGALTMCIDWSSPVKVSSTYGTSDEFFRPSFVQCIGAHASYMSPDGVYSSAYVHAYGPIGSYVKKNASFTCNVTFFLVRKACETLCVENPSSVNLWFDTARHFKNKILLNELPSSIFRDLCPSVVSISFHVPHHGKTPLDASFRRGHSWIGTAVDLQKIDEGVVTQEAAFEHAYSAQVTEKLYKVFFFLPPILGLVGSFWHPGYLIYQKLPTRRTVRPL